MYSNDIIKMYLNRNDVEDYGVTKNRININIGDMEKDFFTNLKI